MDWRQLLVLVLIFVPLERLLPLHAGQGPLRNAWTTDTIYLILNSFVVRFFFVGVLILALPFIEQSVPGSIQATVAGMPLWMQFPLAVLVADLGFYVHHRLFHSVPALWKFHAVHHSIEQLDWLAAHRVHPVDQVASNCLSLLPLFALGFSAETMALHTMCYFIQSHLIHSNTRLRLGPFEWLLASPHFHHWHHAGEETAYNRNFGGQTLIWDRLFRTLHLPTAFPDRYGAGEDVPPGYLRQMAWPFLSLLSKDRNLV